MELRELKASDMGAVCKIISSIGIREFKNCFSVEDFKDGNIEQVGLSVMFDIAGIVLENIPKAQTDIDKFLASVTGQKVNDIQGMNFADYGELIIQVITKKDFQDFFSHVVRLFNH